MRILTRGPVPIAAMFVALAAAAGCSQSTSSVSSSFSSMKSMVMPTRAGHAHGYRASERERECLARAMFFESNRSSRDGLVAVGSVVMNRHDSGKWGDDICDVVGAKRQFAPGVLSRPMNSRALPDVMDAADAVLKGERHPKVSKDVMFFHTAGLKFPYKNMRYTTVAGGNAFYYKAGRKQDRLPVRQDDVLPGMQPVMVAQAEQPRAEAKELPGVAAETAQPFEPVQVAYAGDTPAKPQRTSLFGKRKAQPVEQPAIRSLAAEEALQQDDNVQVALADEAPIPMAAPSEQVAFAAVPEPDESVPARQTRKLKVKRPQAEIVQEASYEAPSEERFGGAMPAYAGGSDTGLSAGDGMGTGVLGQLLIQND